MSEHGRDDPYPSVNVLGEPLESCCDHPQTGFYRDGFCNVGASDLGVHGVCAEVSAEFLEFSRARGNDLSAPVPQFGFPGLKPGDHWCLCAGRWAEALQANAAPRVRLRATHKAALEVIDLADLKAYALDLN